MSCCTSLPDWSWSPLWSKRRTGSAEKCWWGRGACGPQQTGGCSHSSLTPLTAAPLETRPL